MQEHEASRGISHQPHTAVYVPAVERTANYVRPTEPQAGAMEQPFQEADAAPVVLAEHRERMSRGRKLVTIAAGLLVTALVSRGIISGEGDGAANRAGVIAAPSAERVLEDFDGVPAVSMTDEDLANGGYNCGKGLENFKDNHFSFESQIAYLNEKPELTTDLYDFNVNDAKYGMGKKAWDVLMDKGLTNTDTDESAHLDDSSDKSISMDAHLHRIMRAVVGSDQKFTATNFTCVMPDGSIGIRPVGSVAVGEGNVKNAVDGVLLNDEDLKEFKENAENLETFKILDGGMMEITLLDGTTKQIHVNMVGLYFDGCRNPFRIPRHKTFTSTPTTARPPMTVTIPSTTTTTVRPTTTTTAPPSTTTTSTPPVTFVPPVTVPPVTVPPVIPKVAVPIQGRPGETEKPIDQNSNPEEGMDPQNDGANGYGPGDTVHQNNGTVPPTTVETSPPTTAARPNRPVAPVVTIAPVTDPTHGTPAPTPSN